MEAENFKRRPNELSLSRVKTIMKSSPDADNVSQESVYVVTKATELFIKYMVEEAYKQSNNAKTLEYKHVSELVQTREALSFLREMVPRKCSVRDIQENLRRRGLERKRAGLSSSSSDLSLYSDESRPSSPEPRDAKAAPSSVSQETKSVSSAYSPELKSVKPMLPWTRPSLSTTLPSTDDFSTSRKPEASSGTNTSYSSTSLPTGVAHACYSDVVLRPGTPSTITLSSSSREMSCEGSPSPTLSFMEPGPSTVAAPAASPLSVMSASSGSCTPSPSPSYSSLSPQLPSAARAHGEVDMVIESALSDSSVCGFYQV